MTVARPTRGLTVVELLIVMAIMGILMSAMGAGYMRMQANYKVRSGVDRAVSALNMARNLAITHNAVYHVRIENNGTAPGEQAISVYCFPKMSEALGVTSEPLDNSKVANTYSSNPTELTSLAANAWNFTGTPNLVEPTSIPYDSNGLAMRDVNGNVIGERYNNFRVSRMEMPLGAFVGQQTQLDNTSVPTATVDEQILSFLPDGTVNGQRRVAFYVTDDPKMSDQTSLTHDAERFSSHYTTSGGELKVRGNARITIIKVTPTGRIIQEKASDAKVW